MKKLIIVILTITLVVPMFSNMTISAAEISQNDEIIMENDFSLDSTPIEIADSYVESNTSIKRVEINNSKDLSTKLSSDDMEFIKNGVNIVNQLLENGTVVMLEDGSMFFASELRLRGGKLNRSEVFYWGIRRYNNYSNTKRAADELIKTGKQFKTIDAIPSGVLALLGLVGGPVSIIAGVLGMGSVVGNWCYNVGKQLRSKNNTYGTVLDINWVADYKVWKQKKYY